MHQSLKSWASASLHIKIALFWSKHCVAIAVLLHPLNLLCWLLFRFLLTTVDTPPFHWHSFWFPTSYFFKNTISSPLLFLQARHTGAWVAAWNNSFCLMNVTKLLEASSGLQKSLITISSLHTAEYCISVLHQKSPCTLCRDWSSVCPHRLCMHTMGACMCVYIVHIWWVLYIVYKPIYGHSHSGKD